MSVQDLVPGLELSGKVKSITTYGAFINIGVGRDGLVHISELADTRVDKVEDVVSVGQDVTVRVIDVDLSKNRISLTMRTGERPARTERRRRPEVNQAALNALSVGSTVEGVVKSITPIGAFVDIGVGKDGLVHISELSNTRVAKVEDAVSINQGYTFKVIDIDANNGRISLSLRRAASEQQLDGVANGQVVNGTVSGHSPFGVFVNIGVGRDGLVHNTEIPGGTRPAVGSEMTVRVISIDSDNNRISLSGYLDENDRPAQAERPARPARDNDSGERRERRGDRGERRGDRGERRERQADVYTTSSYEEESFEGDASLDDLLARFGGETRNKAADSNDDDDNTSALPSDVIRRTLNSNDK
jgi:ribosomal protein S1